MGAEPFRSMIEGSVALATTVAEAPVRHDLLQLAETAMKEVLAAGNHDYRKVLRSRPLENRSKRHDVVLIPVHDERVLRYELCVDAIDCRSDQGKPLSLKLVHDSRLHICTEGEASEQDRQVAKPSAQMLDQHNQIVGLAYALVVNALRPRKKRIATKPSRQAKENRIKYKKLRADVKQGRQKYRGEKE